MLKLIEEYGWNDDKKIKEDNKKIISAWSGKEAEEHQIEKVAPWLK